MLTVMGVIRECQDMKKTVAFFDLDKTLIKENSGVLWAKNELKSGNLTRLGMVKILVWNLLYHYSMLDIEAVMKKLILNYVGQSEAELKNRTYVWFEKFVAKRLRSDAKAKMREHSEKGHLNVILTNATSYEAEIAAQLWGFDDWIANPLMVDEKGKITGEIQKPMCFGQGKIYYAKLWAEKNGYELESTYFYTDSYSDLEMMEWVDHPYSVTPDPKLRNESQKRNWPILEWN